LITHGFDFPFLYFSPMKKWVHIGLHFLGWSVLLASNINESYADRNDIFNKPILASGLSRGWYCFIFNFCHLQVFLVAFYGAYFLVGPFLFRKKKYVRASILLVFVLAAMVITRYIVEFKLLLPYLKFDNYFGQPFHAGYYIKNCIVFTYRYCLFGLVIYFIEASNRIEKEKKEIEKEKTLAELSFLKSQINPHFLFNTINDIYALTYQKDDKAPDALLKLSAILRYMLKEGSADKVLLAKELTYIYDYIELQRIGLKDKLFVNLVIEGVVDHQQIAPLILIPLVENIFKHGIINDPLLPVELKITIHRDEFTIRCNNKIRRQHKDETSGIGLKNVKRRLELLYPGKFNFTVNESTDSFYCYLQLNLDQ
jgi:two-component system, LytTR family, sensor kinase